MSELGTKRLDSYIESGEISLGRGNIISKDDIEAVPGSYPIYSSSAHNGGKFGEYGKSMFDEELITWSIDGGGYFFYRPKHKYSATNVCGFMRLRSKDLHTKFVYYSLVNQHQFLTFDYTTKAHPSVIKKLYSLPEISYQKQNKISDILSTIDQTIAHTEALIQKYQQIKAGLMHDLFIRGITSDGQLRPPRKEAPELYQETAIGWIPREWKAKDLGSACDWYSGGTPSRGNQEWWEGKVPWLSPKDMKSFDLSDTEEHVTKIAAISGSRLMPPATVFIVIRGMILAHTFPVVYSSSEFCFNQDIKSVSGRDELNNRFLAYWFVSNQDLFLKKTTEATHGTKRFDMKDLYDLIIGVPSPDEQTQIVLRLEVLTDQLKSEGACLSKLKKQKSGLMQDLLTGKVPVTISES